MNALNYPGPVWSPYIVGAGIGVLSWLTFYFSDKSIGASSFYAQVSGFIGKLFTKRHTESLAYFKDNPPSVEWEFIFVVANHRRWHDCSVDGWRVHQRMAPTDVGRALRRQHRVARGSRLGRWRSDGHWSTPCRRLHQRSRHQRNAPTQPGIVDCCGLLFYRRYRRRDAAFQTVRNHD